MKTSALKICTAVAMMTAGCVSFAQQATDANAAGATPAPSSQSVDPATGAPRSGRDASTPPGYDSTMSTYQGGHVNRSCAGLSDRQSERACRQGFPTQHANAPMTGRDQGGPTDDQAD